MKEWKPFYENWRGTRRLPCSYNFSTHKWALSFWRPSNHHSFLSKGKYWWQWLRWVVEFEKKSLLEKSGGCSPYYQLCLYDELVWWRRSLLVIVRKGKDDWRPPACILHSDSHQENYTSMTKEFWNFWMYVIQRWLHIQIWWTKKTYLIHLQLHACLIWPVSE